MIEWRYANCAAAPAGQQHHGGPPGAPLVPPQAVRQQQQQDAGAEREGGRERAERAGQHLGDGVHAAVPEAREDTGRDVQQADEGAGSGDEGRHRLRPRTTQQSADSAVVVAHLTARNPARHFPIYPDRHRIP